MFKSVETYIGSDLSINSLPNRVNLKSPILLKHIPEKKRHSFNFKRYDFINSEYQSPEYNLYEISQAEDADGIIRNAIKKKRALAAKAGWSLTGKNQLTVDYIKDRFLQLGLSQNKDMELLIKETVGDLVRYHNSFWLKVRDEDGSGGKKRTVIGPGGKKTLKPVAAYFRIAPETIKIKTDDYGNIKKYMQMMPDGRYKEYPAHNVIHYYFNRRAGFNFSAPGLLPTVEDIKALRRIEEQVEILIEQHLFPLTILSIGTDEFPAQTLEDGTSEIDIWTSKIETMPSSGGLVVDHRMKLETLSSKETIAVEKYLEHFKKRAYTSAGVSNLDMGEGEGMNRSTADNASKILIDDVKDYQHEFKLIFQHEVIKELLLENYTINALLDKNIVRFTWKEIDLNSKIKWESHNSTMFVQNMITHDEARERMGEEILDTKEKQSGLYVNLIAPIAQNVEMEAAAELAKNKTEQKNQHGSSGPETAKSSIRLNESLFYDVIDDFNINDTDCSKLKAIDWFFSLDLQNMDNKISNRILDFIEAEIEDAADKIKYNLIDESSAKEILANNILDKIEHTLN